MDNHVSFGNIVFGLASAQHSTGFVGCAAKAQQISSRRVKTAIREMAQCITIGRQWYAVYRAMADLKVVKESDYEVFCSMIKDEVPEHEHLPTRTELQRLEIQSFSKPVVFWDISNAPVQGKRFYDYLNIAEETKKILVA